MYNLLLFLLSVSTGIELSRLNRNVDRKKLALAIGELFLQFGEITTNSQDGKIGGVLNSSLKINLGKLAKTVNDETDSSSLR